ncbi:MAG: hypothetical protein ABIZ64_08005 [Casimicrobium sp.]
MNALKCLVAMALVAVSSGVNAVEVIVNGGFESNTGAGSASFSNWTIIRENSAGVTGNFLVQTGTQSPTTRFAVPLPPGGAFTAMTDQTGPGRTAIYQDITVPSTGAVWLGLRLHVQTQSDEFAAPATLDFNVVPNQQVRVDVMNPAAAAFDVGAGVLTNVYATQTSTIPDANYFPLSINLKPFAGQTVRIRISEVDNLHGLVVGVDQVSVTSVPVGTCAPTRPRAGGAACNLDLDGDGLLTATDALIATRYLLGFRNAALGQGIAFDACATNTSAAGLTSAASLLLAGSPPVIDIDGDGLALGSTDGLLLVRSLVGLTGTSATNGAVASLPASRRAWTAARDYLNQTCLAGVL